MSDSRNWGQTVLGWFIVRDGEPGGPDAPMDVPVVEDPGASAAVAGAPAAVDPATFSAVPAPGAGGQVDFEAVFNASGIDADERDRVKKAADLLGSLPAETPIVVRKQIVEASLKAFGVPIVKIIETGVEEIQALERYIQAGAVDTQKVLDESRRRIAEHERAVQDLRTIMDQRVQEQQAIAAASNAKKLDVQRVLEFFGQEAVARVVRESPKLVDPSAPGAPPAP